MLRLITDTAPRPQSLLPSYLHVPQCIVSLQIKHLLSVYFFLCTDLCPPREKYTRFWSKALTGGGHLEKLGVGIKVFLNKYDRRLWTVFI